MQKPNLFVVLPPDHYVLKKVLEIRDVANISVGNDPATIERAAPQAEVILYAGLTGKSIPFREVWKHADGVRWIHTLSAGLDKLLTAELINSPVVITNARGVYKGSLAEFVIAGMLFFSKRIRRLVDNQRAHRWDDFTVDWLRGKVMGVVGYGEIGQECARLAKAAGVRVYATRKKTHLSQQDPYAERIFPTNKLSEMLKEIDVLVAAAPLTPETHHMISSHQFAVMKPTALVMNVGRGPVIDETALVQALRQGQVAGAALDVFETEPLAPDHPFWDMDNVLISPHCTDRTTNPDWLEMSAEVFLENFRHYINGEPLKNVVDKKAGY